MASASDYAAFDARLTSFAVPDPSAPTGQLTGSDIGSIMAQYGVPAAVWKATLFSEDTSLNPYPSPNLGTPTNPEDSIGMWQFNILGGAGTDILKAGYPQTALTDPYSSTVLAAQKMAQLIGDSGATGGDDLAKMKAVMSTWPGAYSQPRVDAFNYWEGVTASGSPAGPTPNPQPGAPPQTSGPPGSGANTSGTCGSWLTDPICNLEVAFQKAAVIWLLGAIALAFISGGILWIANSQKGKINITLPQVPAGRGSRSDGGSGEAVGASEGSEAAETAEVAAAA